MCVMYWLEFDDKGYLMRLWMISSLYDLGLEHGLRDLCSRGRIVQFGQDDQF